MPTPIPSADLRKRLDGIVRRRNRIVHEGDYEPLERPRTPRLIPMSLREARREVRFIEDLVTAIHTAL